MRHPTRIRHLINYLERQARGKPAPRVIASLLSLFIIGLGCARADKAPSEATAQPDPNAIVRMAAPEQDFEGAGPKSTHFAYQLNLNVYEPLIYLRSDYTFAPGLAESWELVEPNTWRFHLRRGVKFHDGKPFTADDVMWTWNERQRAGETLTTVTNTLRFAENPDAVKKVDDFTVDFTPKVPNLRLPEQIVHPEGAIVPRGKDFDSSPPVGTGPFRVVEFKPNESVKLERFDDHWGTKAQVKGLEVRFLPEPQTRIEALRAGEVDFVLDFPPDAVSSIEGDDRFRVVRAEPGRNQLVYLSRNPKPGFDLTADRAVRQAISLALDREAYVETVFEGNAEPGRWMAPRSALGGAADIVKAVPYDPDQAKEVLDKAGWEAGGDGIRTKGDRRLGLTLIAWAEVSDAALQFIQAQLKAVGIETSIKKAPDQPTYRTYYTNGEFDLDLEVPNQNDGNPAFLPVLRMYSKNTGTERFAPGGEFDSWADKALSAKTREDVQRASAEMMRILSNDEYVVVPLAGVYRIYAMSSKVNLADAHPSRTNQVWVGLTKSK